MTTLESSFWISDAWVHACYSVRALKIRKWPNKTSKEVLKYIIVLTRRLKMITIINNNAVIYMRMMSICCSSKEGFSLC
jgi:hypothetical protein